MDQEEGPKVSCKNATEMILGDFSATICLPSIYFH